MRCMRVARRDDSPNLDGSRYTRRLWMVNANNEGVSRMIAVANAAVTVTGSCAPARRLVLRLGGAEKVRTGTGWLGSVCVLNDADLELAVKPRLQDAIKTPDKSAPPPILLSKRALRRRFTDRFVAAAAAVKIGDPLVERMTQGPMARDLRDELHQRVRASVAEGARLC
ncbi:aldehyde dehydrogenase family protein [Salmonella enterica subsp. enterica]|nr:aldehyde dehydrogenase family protein [Salmonella enterica subsp. enterica]